MPFGCHRSFLKLHKHDPNKNTIANDDPEKFARHEKFNPVELNCLENGMFNTDKSDQGKRGLKAELEMTLHLNVPVTAWVPRLSFPSV